MTCPFCGDPILPGQPVIRENDGSGDILHLDCSAALADGDDIDMDHGDN